MFMCVYRQCCRSNTATVLDIINQCCLLSPAPTIPPRTFHKNIFPENPQYFFIPLSIITTSCYVKCSNRHSIPVHHTTLLQILLVQ